MTQGQQATAVSTYESSNNIQELLRNSVFTVTEITALHTPFLGYSVEADRYSNKFVKNYFPGKKNIFYNFFKTRFKIKL